jgi:hypothetical protein
MNRTPILIFTSVILLWVIGLGLPSVYAQRATATPKPPFPICQLYPTRTLPRGVTPTATLADAPIAATLTPIPRTATPAAPTNPTAIPTGKQPAELLISVRHSLNFQRGGKTCLEVWSVTPYGPGDLAGVQRGDLLLGIDKTQINQLPDLYDSLVKLKSGDKAVLVIQRGNTVESLTVTLGLR